VAAGGAAGAAAAALGAPAGLGAPDAPAAAGAEAAGAGVPPPPPQALDGRVDALVAAVLQQGVQMQQLAAGFNALLAERAAARPAAAAGDAAGAAGALGAPLAAPLLAAPPPPPPPPPGERPDGICFVCVPLQEFNKGQGGLLHGFSEPHRQGRAQASCSVFVCCVFACRWCVVYRVCDVCRGKNTGRNAPLTMDVRC
jgi:hypothetical protein